MQRGGLCVSPTQSLVWARLVRSCHISFVVAGIMRTAHLLQTTKSGVINNEKTRFRG
jgi:hypothetical protein